MGTFLLLIVLGVGKLNLFLDISGSMKGYVSTKSEFSRFIYSLRDMGLEASITHINTYFISQNVAKSALVPEKIAFNRGVFSGGVTNLVAALREIKRHPEDINVLVTDWVLSLSKESALSGYDLYSMKKELLKLVSGKYTMAFIGVLSDFDGIVYSETYSIQHTGLPKFKWKGKRPFYILIVSENKSLFKRVFRIIDNFFSENQLESRALYLPSVSVLLPYINLNDIKVFPPRGKSNFIMNKSSETDTITEVEYVLISEVKGRKNIVTKVPVTLNGIDKNLMDLFKRSNVTVNYEISVTKGPVQFPGFDVEYESNMVVFRYNKLFTKFLKSKKSAVLDVKFVPEEVRVTGLWEDWSTDNDALRENAGKTLYLSETLNFLVKTYINQNIREFTYRFIFMR